MRSYRSLPGQYFEFDQALGHSRGCPNADTAACDVTLATDEHIGSRHYDDEQTGKVYTNVTFRLLCRVCGQVAFYAMRTDCDGPSFEFTHVRSIGYGSKPEHSAGLWLHAGPCLEIGDGNGPMSFFVTATAATPQNADDVVGIVGWTITKRGATRWSAGIGCTKYGHSERSTDEQFKSRRAAVKWVAEQHQAVLQQAAEQEGGAL